MNMSSSTAVSAVENQKDKVQKEKKKKSNWKPWAIFGGCSLVLGIILFIIIWILKGSGGRLDDSKERTQNYGPGGKNRPTDGAVDDESGKNGGSSTLAKNIYITKLESLKARERAKPVTKPTDTSNKSGTDTSSTPITDTSSTPGTDTSSTPGTDDSSAPVTDTSSAPLVDPVSENMLKFPLPKNNYPPIPDEVKSLANNLVMTVDSPKAFADTLSKLRKAVFVPGFKVGLEVESYADSVAEEHLREEFNNILVSEQNQDVIKSALETYHKVIRQTKAGAKIPNDLKDIKDVEMYQIVRKSITERALSTKDKTRLQDILLGPDNPITMSPESSFFLGRKLTGCTEEEAAATIKAYFTGNEETKDLFKNLSNIDHSVTMIFPFDMNRGELLAMVPPVVELMLQQSVELKDEILYRTDAQALLQELLSNSKSELLESINRNEVPSIDSIKAAEAVLPTNDPLFMAKFARYLPTYVRIVGFEHIQTNPENRDAIDDVMKYCRSSLAPRYIGLVNMAPVDPRIINLDEWKNYINNHHDIKCIARLFKAVTDLEIDLGYLINYVRAANRVKTYDDPIPGQQLENATNRLYSLFRFKFPNNHPFNIMREHLFDTNNGDYGSALKNFMAKPIAELTPDEQELRSCL